MLIVSFEAEPDIHLIFAPVPSEEQKSTAQ